MRNFERSRGFTLIELVIIIIILGILAVTAAPKFIDMSTESRLATMKAFGGNLKSAATIFNAKAIISNAGVGYKVLKINGMYYSFYNGYPDTHNLGNGSGDSVENAVGALGLVDTDIEFNRTQQIQNGKKILIFGLKDHNWCQVYYHQAEGNNAHEISYIKYNC